jgi:hypothetical protein
MTPKTNLPLFMAAAMMGSCYPIPTPTLDALKAARKQGPSQKTLNKRARLGKDKW